MTGYPAGVILLPAFALCMLLAGFVGSAWLWSLDTRTGEPGLAPGPVEALASSMLVTVFGIVGVDWILAPLHAVTTWALSGTGALLAVVAALSLVRARRRDDATWQGVAALGSAPLGLGLLPVLSIALPVVGWLAFMAWRGSLTPVLSHDAYAYHMPRAVDVVKTGTWRYLSVEDFRLGWFPADYELMLADCILLGGGARAANFLALAHYASGLLLCAAYGERRCGTGPKAWIGALAWAASPVVLLHAGAQKNDLLTMIGVLGVALFGARWVFRGGTAPLVLALASAALGLGTKWIGAAVAPAFLIAFLPFGLLRRARATFTSTASVAWLIGGSAALLYLGGITPYVAHLLHLGDARASGFSTDDLWAMNIAPRLGHPLNVLKFVALLWMRPFGESARDVWVPWASRYWFWPRHELYFSDFGLLVSCLACLSPLAWWLRRRLPSGPQAEARRERSAASLFLAIVLVLVASMVFRTDGFFAGYPRFLLFVPLLVVDAGVIPLLDGLGRNGRQVRADRIASLVLAGIAVVFCAEGVDLAQNDGFAPLDYVVTLAKHPEVRRPYFGRDGLHAEQVVSEQVPVTDRVAIDGGFGAWVYAAYDDALTRTVDVLPIDDEGRERILSRADWVAVDRYWSICWGAAEMRDFGQLDDLVNHGSPTRTDVARLEALEKDPRFERVYGAPALGQFLFRRVRR